MAAAAGMGPRIGAGLLPRLFLPSAATGPDVQAYRGGRHRAHAGSHSQRAVRDWVADVGGFAFAALFCLYQLWPMAHDPRVPNSQLTADALVGVAACAAVWLRRRWPVGLAVVLSVACTFYISPTGAGLVALYTLAVHRPLRVVAVVGIPALFSSPVAVLRQDAPLPLVMSWTLTGVGLVCAALGWGMFVRSRHQLVLSLRGRAQRAEVEAGLRAEQARQRTREEVAREMHDVLAHRLSLLSVHAGALEFRSDAPREEIGKAAKVIQESAHQALEDLREVIGVLRSAEGEEHAQGRLQSNLTDLKRLVDESRTSETDVTLVDRVGVTNAPVPERVGRTAYRIAQEGLTNARKHAPGAGAVVTVTGRPGEGLVIEVRNPLPGRDTTHDRRRSAIPGSGQGLIGLSERASLVGGRLEHGSTPSADFRLYAWLPWPAANAA